METRTQPTTHNALYPLTPQQVRDLLAQIEKRQKS